MTKPILCRRLWVGLPLLCPIAIVAGCTSPDELGLDDETELAESEGEPIEDEQPEADDGETPATDPAFGFGAADDPTEIGGRPRPRSTAFGG